MEPLPHNRGGHHVELNDRTPDIVQALAEAHGVGQDEDKKGMFKMRWVVTSNPSINYGGVALQSGGV
jgi:hypothetical protein